MRALAAAHATKCLPTSKLKELAHGLNQPVVLLGGPGDREKGTAIEAGNPLILNTCGDLRLNQSADSSSLGADDKGSDNLLDEYLDKITVVNLGKMGKDIRIKKLIELRTEFFNRDQSAKSMLEEKARLAFKKKYPDYSEASHLQSLNECKLYKLCDKVLRRDRYN